MNIIDEMHKAWAIAQTQGQDANCILVPEQRRVEVMQIVQSIPTAYMFFDKEGSIKCFGCDVVFSGEAKEIKAGYLV